MDERLEQLKQWLADIGQPFDSIEPASADASFRRYFRLTDGESSRIVMDAPPEKEDSAPFVDVAARLQEVGVSVPGILAQDLAQGFVLLDDLGHTLYLDALDADTVERLYGDALEALAAMQAGADTAGLPPYDSELLDREMRLFSDWLVQRQLGLELNVDERELLETVFAGLIENALAQPQVFVHRDYHSRNLMLLPTQNPGILDFQDAVRGPLTYDPVSLLRDCYIAWPRERVNAWALDYRELAIRSGVLAPDTVDRREFLRWFDWMGVQRHLKAAGIFARLNLRDRKPGYLKDIPRTLGYIVEVAPDYEQLRPLGEFIRERVLPGLGGISATDEHGD